MILVKVYVLNAFPMLEREPRRGVTGSRLKAFVTDAEKCM
jgi:hypothetical protein